jgi:hypothetical protein
MIEKGLIGFNLICDICGRLEYAIPTFSEAVDFKRDNDWKSEKYEGEWQDICPECQEG